MDAVRNAQGRSRLKLKTGIQASSSCSATGIVVLVDTTLFLSLLFTIYGEVIWGVNDTRGTFLGSILWGGTLFEGSFIIANPHLRKPLPFAHLRGLGLPTWRFIVLSNPTRDSRCLGLKVKFRVSPNYFCT